MQDDFFGWLFGPFGFQMLRSGTDPTKRFKLVNVLSQIMALVQQFLQQVLSVILAMQN